MNNKNVHRILIPVDFSPAGEGAIEYGAFLANVFRADVLLLHIVEGIHSYPRGWFDDENRDTDKGLIQTRVAAKLGEMAEDITKKYGVYVQNILTTGKPAAKIAEAVVDHDMDLIVMGTHGASGFEELFICAHQRYSDVLYEIVACRQHCKPPSAYFIADYRPE